MKNRCTPHLIIPAAIAFITAAIPSSAGAKTAPPKSTEQAICAVCGPREGSGPEPVRATATYKTKNYAFCAVECKVAFLESPLEFLVTDEGKPAPAFTLKTIQVQTVSLANFKDKVILIDFWGSFCQPCVEALPYLESLQRKYGPKGFVMLGITVDQERAAANKILKQVKVSYPMLISTPKVWSAYKVNTLPALMLIGRDGRIIKRYGGEADKKAMEATIEKALVFTPASPAKEATP